MTPELSRQLAHLATQYDAQKDANLELSIAFRCFIQEHEAEINSIADIPAQYSGIITLGTFYTGHTKNGV